MEIVTETRLSIAEEQRLTELETVIKKNFLGFVAVGKALAEIRDRRLYRDGQGRTFEGYCAEMWEICRQYAYRIIDAATATENVANWLQNNPEVVEITLPQNEAQARELAKLPPDEQPVVWLQVVEEAEEEERPVTAKLTKEKVKAHLGEKFSKQVEKSKKDIRKTGAEKQSQQFVDAWDSFWDQVGVEREKNWRHTSKKVVLKRLKVLSDLVAEDVRQEQESPGCRMELSDREKLRKAGFRICRMDPRLMVIEEYTGTDRWVVTHSCISPKVLMDEYNKIMDDPKSLRA